MRIAELIIKCSLPGAALISGGYAEAVAPDKEGVEVVQITAGRIAEPWLRVPQPITVVTPQEIERQTPQVMVDLLRGHPGIFPQSSGPGQGIAIVRGLKGSEVLHLVDGMRLNMSFFRNSPSQYIALVDPYNIHQIELLRGPAGTLYGSDAMGGVLQVLTPEERFAGSEWDHRTEVRMQLGSAEPACVAGSSPGSALRARDLRPRRAAHLGLVPRSLRLRCPGAANARRDRLPPEPQDVVRGEGTAGRVPIRCAPPQSR